MNQAYLNYFNKYDAIIVFDVETTGLNCFQDEIIDFGAIIITAKQIDKYQNLITSSKMITPQITSLTHITNAMLLNEGITKEQFANDLVKLFNFEHILLVGYNVNFDLGFLFNFLTKHHLTSITNKFSYLDIMTIFKDLKYDYPHKLSDAINYFHITDGINSHRALDDAFATYLILDKMVNNLDDIYQYINLFGYNPKFGQNFFKIKNVKYVPQPYGYHQKLYLK